MKRQIGLIFLHYLRYLAKIQLAKVRLIQQLKGKPLKIVGITGSAGKSSTLACCEAVLQDHYHIKSNSGSNSESGIPLNILGIKATDYSLSSWIKYAALSLIKLFTNWHTYQIYLVEMGVDEPIEPKNMSYLLKIFHPDIGIFLNVNLVHSMQFDNTVSKSITGVKRLDQIKSNIGAEKAKMIHWLTPDGIAILNLNDPIVAATTKNVRAKVVPISPTHINFSHYAPPQSFDLSTGAAIILANIFNIDEPQATKNLQKNLVLPPSRSSIFSGINNSVIIDSSYNSSPLAAAEMLQVLSSYPSPKIAILGDMRELGLQSPLAHQELYSVAVKSSDILISVGPETTKYFGDKAIKFTYYWQAIEYLKASLPPKSTILVKGSQNTIYLEEIVKYLQKNKQDNYSLCRQSKYWQQLKRQFLKSNS